MFEVLDFFGTWIFGFLDIRFSEFFGFWMFGILVFWILFFFPRCYLYNIVLRLAFVYATPCWLCTRGDSAAWALSGQRVAMPFHV